MLKKYGCPLSVFLLVASFFAPAPAQAQTNSQIYSRVQFNFAPPGARGMALAGAILATANNATAAVSNPAGLASLTRIEFSAEGIYDNVTQQYSGFGHAFGEPTGDGIDIVPGIQVGETTENRFGLGYLAAVYPGDDRWSVAIYRHELANTNFSYQRQGVFFDSTESNGDLRRAFPATGDMNLQIVNYGVAGAYRVNEAISIGAGVYIGDLGLSSSMQRFDPRQGRRGNAGAILMTQPADYSSGNLADAQIEAAAARRIGVTLGVMWKITEEWSFGGVFRPGPKYKYDAYNTIGPNSPQGASGTLTKVGATFKVPNQFGLGLAYEPIDNWRIVVDYDRIQYSQMTNSLEKVIAGSDDLKAADANEFHVGVEYDVAGTTLPVAVRGGAWYDPDNSILYTGSAQTESQQREEIAFQPGDDVWHLAGGVGLVFADRYVFDAALDYSKYRTQMSFYFTIQFGNPGSSNVLPPEDASTNAGTR